MYHHHQQQQNHQRHLFLQGGNNGISDTGLVLSTDAKPRLKWTPELHQRFIEAVNQLGGPDKATPKTIMKLMGVPGLTLYHLKSHLQKYRLSKNLQGQVNTGINKIGCPTVVAEERISEVSAALVSNTNLGSQANKNMQINETIQMQIEVQRRLHDQLEVQRHLQLRIEAQGKYLQSVLEKAQETIGRQNLSSTGLDAAKVHLTELVSKVSNECLNSALSLLKESPGLCNQRPQTNQPTDGSIDSCLTTCEGSQKDQEMQNSGMGLRPFHGNGPLAQKETREFRLEQTEFTWCEDLNENKKCPSPMERNLESMMFPVKGSSSDLSMSIRVQGEKRSSGRCISEATLKERDAGDNFLDNSNCRKLAFPLENEKKSTGLELSYATAKLDLNDQDKDDIDSSCKQFDLNGFSWSLEGPL